MAMPQSRSDLDQIIEQQVKHAIGVPQIDAIGRLVEFFGKFDELALDLDETRRKFIELSKVLGKLPDARDLQGAEQVLHLLLDDRVELGSRLVQNRHCAGRQLRNLLLSLTVVASAYSVGPQPRVVWYLRPTLRYHAQIIATGRP